MRQSAAAHALLLILLMVLVPVMHAFRSSTASSWKHQRQHQQRQCQHQQHQHQYNTQIQQQNQHRQLQLPCTAVRPWSHGHRRPGLSMSVEDQSGDGSSSSSGIDRRALLSRTVAAATAALTSSPAHATIGSESNWPLWLALPVAPYSRRKTIMREVKAGSVWTFDQLIGIYYVQLPIRMTVVKMEGGGLFVYAPVAPTEECLSLLQPLIDRYGPVKFIILPSVAVEHKVNAGPFARAFPNAAFYAVDKQYSFPVPLPSSFLGLPSWTKPLPASSNDMSGEPWNGEFEHEVLTVIPGPASAYQDAAFFHKPSKTMMLCDAIFAVDDTPPPILTDADPEYTRALLFHARDAPLEVVTDSPEARKKGWQRIVLLFNFFFPGSAAADLGIKPLLRLGPDPEYGWRGWVPFSWKGTEGRAFEAFSAGGKPTVLPIIEIILSRGGDGQATQEWVDKVARWDFERVVPAHLNAPLDIGPREFEEPFAFIKKGKNEVRFCDEDVAFLRFAEEGFLSFSVFKSKLGVLRGRLDCSL